MKKLLLSVVVFVGFIGIACADNYVVDLSSYTIDSNTTTFAATYPNIAGGAVIDKIVFMTTNTVATPILIGLYDTCTSTTAATVDAYYVLSGTNTTPSSTNQSITVDYPSYNPLKVTNPGFFKADGDTTHKVWMTIQYR